MRTIIQVAGVMLALSALSCKQIKKARTEQTLNIPTVAVKAMPMSISHFYVSDIRAIRNVELRSKVSGFLETIYVDEGQKVKKGQVLFRINDTEFKTNVAKAKAILNTAEAEERVAEVECQRVKLLTDKNIVSKTELELATSKFKAAKARTEETRSDYNSAIHKLSYATICAPFDGVIDRIPLRPGSLIAEGALMSSVSDISSMYAYFDISENEYLAYTRKRNQTEKKEIATATLILADGETYMYKGKVETVVSEFDANTGSISFRATFPNPNNLLKHKATGKIKLSTMVQNALVIPQKATFEVQDKNYVYVLDEDDVVRMKPFEPAERVDEYYIVKSGLNEGDRIVYEGIQDLKDGMKVVPKQLSSDSIYNLTAF